MDTSHTDGPDASESGTEDAGTLRWVKVSWIIAAVIVVVILAALLFGRDHGPGMHSAPQDGGNVSSITAGN